MLKQVMKALKRVSGEEVDLDGEYSDEDHEHTLLLIGSGDDGDVYISVNDRYAVTLAPGQAIRAAWQIAVRAIMGGGW